MTSKQTTTPFGDAALALDREFLELEKLAQKLERLSLQTDQGMERAYLMIKEAEESRERLIANMQTMASALEDARARSEAAIRSISAQANALQERQAETARLAARFQALGEMVRQISAAIAQLKAPTGAISPEERASLDKALPEFNTQMNVLINEATSLMEEAQEANLRSLASNADALRQSLDAARQRLNLLTRPPESPSHTLH